MLIAAPIATKAHAMGTCTGLMSRGPREKKLVGFSLRFSSAALDANVARILALRGENEDGRKEKASTKFETPADCDTPPE
jgi:hypothetical protein